MEESRVVGDCVGFREEGLWFAGLGSKAQGF